MAGIGITVDDGDWQVAMSLFARLIPDMLVEAGMDGGEEIAKVAIDLLGEHAHGAGTYSGSPPGTPPGAISGDLGGSYLVTPAEDGALVGPTADYAREQEMGGEMHGHTHMKWTNEGGKWYRKLVDLPARPYHKPATNRVVDSGQLTAIYYEHLARVIQEVTG
jgi:phage gpG-like protein